MPDSDYMDVQYYTKIFYTEVTVTLDVNRPFCKIIFTFMLEPILPCRELNSEQLLHNLFF